MKNLGSLSFSVTISYKVQFLCTTRIPLFHGINVNNIDIILSSFCIRCFRMHQRAFLNRMDYPRRPRDRFF